MFRQNKKRKKGIKKTNEMGGIQKENQFFKENAHR